ncbi:hypothetical protein [Sorangium sp. So ce1078]|uniref:hypothetical protein n=1 Tax=Sorangium sp. So ce1078 TaxID=3133329 RepID=UPI003F5E3F9A
MTCPRLSRRGALCVVLALCAFSLGSPRVASAAPPLPRLAVHRTPAAADCPDAESLAAAVERVMNRRAVEPASAGGAPAAAGGAAAGADSPPADAGGAPGGPGGAAAGADGGAASPGGAAAGPGGAAAGADGAAADPGGVPAGAGGVPAGAGGVPAGAGGVPAGASGVPAGAGGVPAGAGGVPAGAGGSPAGLAPASAGVAPEFEVHFLRADATYTAVLRAGGRARQLSSEAGATCDELVGAVALTVAILLDSQPAPPPAPAPAAPAPAPAPVAPVPPRPPRQAPRGDVSLELGAAGTVGVLDPFRPAATADVSLRRSAWSAGLGAVWLPRQDIEFTPGVVSVGLVAATARGCATILGELDGTRLSACAVSLLGAVHGTGKGFTPDREASAPWLAVGGSAIAEGTLFGTRALGWAARATLLAPVVRARITIERRSGTEAGAAVTKDPALDPSPVGLLVGLSARVSIF